MPHITIRYEREKLYDEVWEEPVTAVAKRYGVSDVALRKNLQEARCAAAAAWLLGSDRGRQEADQAAALQAQGAYGARSGPVDLEKGLLTFPYTPCFA